jgi:hypothetical protein
MAWTSTRFLSFDTLHTHGQAADTVVKLMMACNDLSLANQALSDWKKEQPSTKKPRQTGAGMYFIRMQLAHLYEGLKVIEEIKKDQFLVGLLGQCDAETQRSFHELTQFLPDGSCHSEFERLVGKVRHNLAFHYYGCGKLINRAIADRAARQEARTSSVTRGDTAYLWYFKVADDVVDSIVVRQIWAIPRYADMRAEADKVADRAHQIFRWFVDFAGEFIWKYCGH